MFRPEALEHRASSQAAGGALRSEPRWADRAFWLLLTLVAVALIAGTRIRIDKYVTAPTATAPDGRVLILVPASVARSLEPGSPVSLGGVETEVSSISRGTLGAEQVKNLYGIDVTAPAVAVETTLRGNEVTGSARVVVGSDPVLVSLIPGLDSLLGDDDG